MLTGAVDRRVPGTGRDHQLLPIADRGPDRHTGRPRRADRSGHRQPRYRCSGRLATRATSSPRPLTHCRNSSMGLPVARPTSAMPSPTRAPSPASVADMLSQARAPLKTVVAQTDRVSGLVVADHEYVDNLLNTLPDAYQRLARQGLHGDYFSYYICDLLHQGQWQGRPACLRQTRYPGHGTVRSEMKHFSERNPAIIGVIGVALTAVVTVACTAVQASPVLRRRYRALRVLRRSGWPEDRCRRAGGRPTGGRGRGRRPGRRQRGRHVQGRRRRRPR